MLSFTIVKGKIVLDPNIVLFGSLSDLYEKVRGEALLRVIYYMHSRDTENPFRDLEERILEENVLQVVFSVANWNELKLTKVEKHLYLEAEKTFIKYNLTAESRLEKAIDKKIDEITIMLNDTTPTIEESVTKNGEVKFNTNLNIILNLFTKIETIMKSKTVLQNAILKQEGKGKIKGGGTTSFRELGTLGKR